MEHGSIYLSLTYAAKHDSHTMYELDNDLPKLDETVRRLVRDVDGEKQAGKQISMCYYT